MSAAVRLCLINAYPRQTQDLLSGLGMCSAHGFFERALRRMRPDVAFEFETLWIAEVDALPETRWFSQFAGVLWGGTDLTIWDDDPRVKRMIELASRIFEAGPPQWASCGGTQIAAVAAGGEVRRNPNGREIGFGRKIATSAEGRAHPMYEGKPAVFDAFISHLDEITRLPQGATLLASNAHTTVQALEIRAGRGILWATQYHPEWDLYGVSRLMTSRAEALLREGFFADRAALDRKMESMAALDRERTRTDLRWDLALGDDILDDDTRQRELRNWLDKLVLS